MQISEADLLHSLRLQQKIISSNQMHLSKNNLVVSNCDRAAVTLKARSVTSVTVRYKEGKK